MDLKELMQTMVETDDKMSRMALVEENAALMETAQPAEMDNTALTELQAKYDALQAKYISTFFGGGEAEKKEEEKPEKEESVTMDSYLQEVTE